MCDPNQRLSNRLGVPHLTLECSICPGRGKEPKRRLSVQNQEGLPLADPLRRGTKRVRAEASGRECHAVASAMLSRLEAVSR